MFGLLPRGFPLFSFPQFLLVCCRVPAFSPEVFVTHVGSHTVTLRNRSVGRKSSHSAVEAFQYDRAVTRPLVRIIKNLPVSLEFTSQHDPQTPFFLEFVTVELFTVTVI